MQLGYNKYVRRANEATIRRALNPTSKNVLYGDKGTVYNHECKPPICSVCHHLTVRPVTKKEKETVWPAYEAAHVAQSALRWCRPVGLAEKPGEAEK